MVGFLRLKQHFYQKKNNLEHPFQTNDLASKSIERSCKANPVEIIEYNLIQIDYSRLASTWWLILGADHTQFKIFQFLNTVYRYHFKNLVFEKITVKLSKIETEILMEFVLNEFKKSPKWKKKKKILNCVWPALRIRIKKHTNNY